MDNFYTDLSLLFHVKDKYHIKRNWLRFNCLQQTSMQLVPCFTFFRQIFLFCVIFRSWSFSKKWSAMKDLLNDKQYDYVCKIFFPNYQFWSHNIFYLTWYLVFPAFWSHSVLLQIGQYTNSNLMIYSLSIFGKTVFVAP